MKETFDAYYYSLYATGCSEIDAILKEVASAGKGCHHTEDWVEFGYIEKIQDAANKAANFIVTAQQPRAVDVIASDKCPDCGGSGFMVKIDNRKVSCSYCNGTGIAC